MIKTAKLYRMVTDEHICPYGIKSKDLLKRKGYDVEDHHLKTREEADAFMKNQDVKTTPQTYIDENRIAVMMIWLSILTRIPLSRKVRHISRSLLSLQRRF